MSTMSKDPKVYILPRDLDHLRSLQDGSPARHQSMEPPPPDLAKIPSIMESSTLLSVFDNDPVTGEQTLASLESGGEAPHFIPRFDFQPLPDLGPEDLIEISSPEAPGTVSCQDSGTEESLTVPEPQPGKRRGEPDFSHVLEVCNHPPLTSVLTRLSIVRLLTFMLT